MLEQDIEQGQSIAEMFALITAQKDRSRFFYFARMLFWCDGDFAEQEQKILTALAKTNFDSLKVDEIAAWVNFVMEASGAAANKSDRPIESGGWTPSSIRLKAAGLELEANMGVWIEEDMKNAPQKMSATSWTGSSAAWLDQAASRTSASTTPSYAPSSPVALLRLPATRWSAEHQRRDHSFGP